MFPLRRKEQHRYLIEVKFVQYANFLTNRTNFCSNKYCLVFVMNEPGQLVWEKPVWAPRRRISVILKPPK